MLEPVKVSPEESLQPKPRAATLPATPQDNVVTTSPELIVEADSAVAKANVDNPAPQKNIGKLDITWGSRTNDDDTEVPTTKPEVGRLSVHEWEYKANQSRDDAAAHPPEKAGDLAPQKNIGKLDISWGSRTNDDDTGVPATKPEVGRLSVHEWEYKANQSRDDVSKAAKSSSSSSSSSMKWKPPPPVRPETLPTTQPPSSEGAELPAVAPIPSVTKGDAITTSPELISEADSAVAKANVDNPAPQKNIGKLDISWGSRTNDDDTGVPTTKPEVGRLSVHEWEYKANQSRDDVSKAAKSSSSSSSSSSMKWKPPPPVRPETLPTTQPSSSEGAELPAVAPIPSVTKGDAITTSPELMVETEYVPRNSAGKLSIPQVDRTGGGDDVMMMPARATCNSEGEVQVGDVVTLDRSGVQSHPGSRLISPTADIDWGDHIADEGTKPRVSIISGGERDGVAKSLVSSSLDVAPQEIKITMEQGVVDESTVDSPSSITSFLATRPVGRIDATYPVQRTAPRKQQPNEDALIGKLHGDEWAPSSGSRNGGNPEDITLESGNHPSISSSVNAKSISDLLGIVSRSRTKFDSLGVEAPHPPDRPPAPHVSSVITEEQSSGASRSPSRELPHSPAGGVSSLHGRRSSEARTAVGLISDIISIFDQDATEGDTGKKGVEERHVQLRPGGRRRAKLDAALALAASRSRLQRKAAVGRQVSANDLAVIKGLFRGESGDRSLDMGAFARAMNIPSVQALIKEIAAKEIESESGCADVEALFKASTIRNAAAVTLQAKVRGDAQRRKRGGETKN